MVDDLLALQRQIDGYSSSGEDDHEEDSKNEQECSVTSDAVSKVTSGPHEKEAPGNGGSSEDDDDETKNDEQPTHADDDDDVAFDLAAVVMEGRKERKERRKKLAQEKRDRDSGVVSGVSLPCPEAEIELMKKRVREETERRMLEERRSHQQRPEELTHVSAGRDGPAGAPHLSRRERRQQKAKAATKKPQQVYVGLPIGTSWHVPLVGIEGRGGYKQPSGSSKDADDGSGDIQTGSGGEKRKAMTIKEREKLKRQKGQSSHSTWKPELWMQLRQQYD
ncbi:hypothetical protein CSUI_003731 [Cystoisospora suis]|uniref:Uncharacterized protein n=1 Tax=Cystoisospora suis TaxID=483139 RepID=A0A2C6KZS1_9APIC|nr:hypothetical protein CSUI_003731 [Cystoisospora suis]